MLNKILKVGKAILLLLLILWELPQNIAGLLLYIYFRINKIIRKTEIEKLCLFLETRKTGVSLGRFIYWTPQGNRYSHLKNDCKMHEYGHSLQSIMLGPLYLIVVGIPSVSRVWYSRYFYKKHSVQWKHYFNAFPENWADKLGKVTKQR